MTTDQVWKFVKKKAKVNSLVGEIMSSNLNKMNYYKNQGYSFRCEDAKLIASKSCKEDITFDFGGLKEFIEQE